MPTKETDTSFVGGSNCAVFKSTKNRDAAWKFVEWMSKPEMQAKWYEVSSDLPSNQAAWELPALTEDENVKLFGEQLKDAKSPPPFPKWEQIGDVAQHRAREGRAAVHDERRSRRRRRSSSIGTVEAIGAE